MKRLSTRSSLRKTLTIGFVLIFLGAGTLAFAQEPAPPNAPQPDDEQQAQAPEQKLSSDQLDNLVAPIALYPDPLLSQVLVASTYSLEVVEAQQWLQQNKTLRGDQLVEAARQQNWDASVQALVALPDVLSRLNQDIRWTTDLGNAFLSQQADVMSAVQRMRSRAKDSGKLSSTPQQTVTTETKEGQTAIEIQPADPQVIYVPVYDPAYIWGPPAWGIYPPLYYSGFGFGFGAGINLGFSFGGWGGWGGWGWSPGWFGHTVIVNNNFFHRYGFHGPYGVGGRGVWAHNPGHRLGVPYSNHALASRFQARSAASRAATWRSAAPHSFGQPNAGMRNGFQARPGPSRSAGPQFHSAPRMSAPAPHGGGGGFHGGGHGGGGGGHR